MPFNRKFVNVVGMGFAGIECALFLANHGIKVHIFDSGKVFEKDVFAQDTTLVKEKNKFLLTEELAILGSPLILEGERKGLTQREILELGKKLLLENENVRVINACVHELNPSEVTIITTGSYTDEGMSDFLIKKFGGMLCKAHMPFYPIFQVDGSGLDEMYGNKLLGLSYDEYIKLINSVLDELRENEIDPDEMIDGTIEKLVFEGKNSLRDYSLRPIISKNNDRPYATIKFIQRENGLLGVGLASSLPKVSQERIFSNVQFLKNASIINEAKMLKVCQISSPYVVSEFHQALTYKNIFFAGSILGISGYVDCIASGLYTALNVLKYFNEDKMVKLSNKTAIGKMAEVIATEDRVMGGFLEDYHIFSKSDIEKENIEKELLGRSIEELANFREDYNGKHV